jgi:hypothetical protein
MVGRPEDALTAEQLNAGCVPFLQAGDPQGLRTKLAAEEELADSEASR